MYALGHELGGAAIVYKSKLLSLDQDVVWLDIVVDVSRVVGVLESCE